MGAILKMRAGAFVLPELFPQRRGQFRVRAATATDRKRERVAFLRTALPHRGVFAECQPESAHALFAKIDDDCRVTRHSTSRSIEPAKIQAPAHAALQSRFAHQALRADGMCVALRAVRNASKRTHHHLSRDGSALRRGKLPTRTHARETQPADSLQGRRRGARVALHVAEPPAQARGIACGQKARGRRRQRPGRAKGRACEARCGQRAPRSRRLACGCVPAQRR
ncbi:MAG: hypothetical protein QOC61_135 [Acidobacteriota bacterium]|nr:hypothetical protein [Acidobacteriota bacterium]